MTEAEWNACADPTPMLAFLRGKASDRRLRLFACACCRRIWRHLTDERSRAAVELAERYADGLTLEEELQTAYDAACDATDAVSEGAEKTDASYAAFTARGAAADAARTTAYTDPTPAAGAARSTSEATADAADHAARDGNGARRSLWEEWAAHCALLRDIFGNPFHSVVFNPSWRTPGLISQAQSIYDARAFGDLPLLADALEKAGCTNPAILAHCREPGEHVRGCWVVDLLLGKT